VFDEIPDPGIQLESEKGGWDKKAQRKQTRKKGLNFT
jgi:hypothetical protein